jgi:hypothetical protein
MRSSPKPTPTFGSSQIVTRLACGARHIFAMAATAATPANMTMILERCLGSRNRGIDVAGCVPSGWFATREIVRSRIALKVVT